MINVDNLRKMNKKKKQAKKDVYKKILKLLINKVKLVANTEAIDCWYEVEYFLIGYPTYNIEDCCNYLVKKLKKSNFKEVTYFKPNIIYLNWDTISEDDEN